MRRGLTSVLLCSGLFVITATAGFCRSWYQDGVDSYKAGHYEEAVRSFDNLLTTDSRNQSARYYLACSLVRLKDHARASEQYRLAYLLDPSSSIGGYCRQAMIGYKMPLPTNEHVVVKELPKQEEAGGPTVLDSAKLTIRRQAGDVRQHYRAHSQYKERNLKSSVEEELKAIDDQMQGDIARLHDPIVYNPGPRANPLLYLPDLMKEKEDAIRKYAQDRKADIIREAQEKSENTSGIQKARESVLDDVAHNLEGQLTAPHGPSGVRLDPKGTNLYVRNYASTPTTRTLPDAHPAVVRLVNHETDPPPPAH